MSTERHHCRHKLTLFICNGVEENAQGPHVLFTTAIRLALEHFRGRVIYSSQYTPGGDE